MPATTQASIVIKDRGVIMNADPLLSSTNSATEIILSDESETVKCGGSYCYINMSAVQLTIENKKNKRQHIDVADIIGATQSTRGKTAGRALDIHCYAYDNGCCCSTSGRKKTTLNLTFDDESSCTAWCNAINCTSQGLPLIKDDMSNIQAPAKRKYMVFVNPVGGTGIAVRIWERYTLPFFNEAGVEYDLVITERANHAKDLMSTCDLSCIHTVVIVGGDGLIFEVVSGLMNRSDKDEVMKRVNISPIPGGSGNGLIKSILYECNERYSPMNAAFLAVKGSPSPLDISLVNTLHEQHMSFLILGWGLISDVDILSEPYRWMGETRFDVYAVYRLILKKLYRGRLSLYLGGNRTAQEGTADVECPVGEEGSMILPPLDEPLDTANDPRWKVIEDDFVLVWILQTSHCSANIYSGPGARIDDGVFTVIVVRDTSRCHLLSFLLAMESGDHMKDPNLEIYKATAYRLEPLTEEGLYTLDGEVVEYGPIQGAMRPGSLRVLKTVPRT